MAITNQNIVKNSTITGNISNGVHITSSESQTKTEKLLQELDEVQKKIGSASAELSDALDKAKKALKEDKPAKAKSFLKELSDGATNILSAFAGKTMRAFMDLD